MASAYIKKQIKIRRHKLSDADDIYRNISDKTIYRFTRTIPYPYKKRDAIDFVESTAGLRNKKSAYQFAIAEKITDKVIGGIGLMNFDWKNKNAELGYWIGKKYRGKGYAPEAINLILKFGFKELKLNRIWAAAFETNISSIKVLKKTNFKYEGLMRKTVLKLGKWQNQVMYSMLSSEFKP